MSNTVIDIENISKQYMLGSFGTGTLSHDLNRWWARVRGKEDPFLRVGDTNDRTKKSDSDFVWALRDISFKVEQGDVVGIIGKNGAGKSTLLKILSRVTSPTLGSIKIKGRLASLLEVGTGFHSEMTGRENIFMNGSIMGMTKQEIKSKLDEIVDFAGVAKYIDTPVKRYSSGMMVRLGFAVAAHLEPEILVVDEVLAVGDAEFQKKAVGKMQDVAHGKGRTVLFISHNMAAVRSLCTRGVVLKNGMVDFMGSVPDSLEHYLKNEDDKRKQFIIDNPMKTKSTIKIHNIEINGTKETQSVIASGQEFVDVLIEGTTTEDMTTDVMLVFKNKDGMPMASYALGHYKGKLIACPKGDFSFLRRIALPKILNKGLLYVDLFLHHPMMEWQMWMNNCCILECEGYQEGYGKALDMPNYGIMGLDDFQ